MTPAAIYLSTGLAIFLLGTAGLFWHTRLIRRALSLNFMGAGVFMFLVALGRRSSTPFADPVPHALVLTGLVVAVSTTALLLVLICRFFETGGGQPEDDDSAGDDSPQENATREPMAEATQTAPESGPTEPGPVEDGR
jgi:multicomponent Na+:H+ antiporter subunit C